MIAEKAAVNGASSRDAADTLFLFVRCHEWLVALDGYWIDRMVLASELPAAEAGETNLSGPLAPGLVGKLMIDGHAWPAWDLGLILDMDPLESAWVLMRCGLAEGEKVAVALRVGSCISFGPLDPKQRTPLPWSMCRKPGVFDAAFRRKWPVLALMERRWG